MSRPGETSIASQQMDDGWSVRCRDRYERWYRFVASPLKSGPPPSVSSRSVPKRWTVGFSYFVIGPPIASSLDAPVATATIVVVVKRRQPKICQFRHPKSAPTSGACGGVLLVRRRSIESCRSRVRDGGHEQLQQKRWRRKSNGHIQKARGAGAFASIHSTVRHARTRSLAPEARRNRVAFCASLRAAPTVKSVSLDCRVATAGCWKDGTNQRASPNPRA
jgi:hypothetical protein